MPGPNTLGEAILRALGDFGQDVGGQMQANELYNQQAQHKNLWDRLNFEATQDYRQEGLDLRGRGLDIAQQGQDLRFAQGQNRILEALSPQQPQFETEKDLDLHMRLTDPEAYYEHKRRLKGPVKAERPAATPLQTHNLLNELIGGRRKKILSDAQAHKYKLEDADLPHPDYDIKSRAGLTSAAQWGLSQEKDAPGWFTGNVPDPDSTFHGLGQKYDQYDDPTRQAGLRDSITAGQIFPEIFGGQQQIPAPPANWPGTEAEWLDYLQKKATQGR